MLRERTIIRYPMGRPRFRHPWESIPVGAHLTVPQVADRLKISRKALYLMIEQKNNCHLPPGFAAKRIGSRHIIERISAERLRDY